MIKMQRHWLKAADGIGTEAIRAGIIEKLIDKKFISVDKKQKVAFLK